MADPLSDWKEREFAPSELPPNGELTYPEPAGTMPPRLPGMASEHDGLRNNSGASNRLNSAAETIGGAVGSAVGSMRRLPENMKTRLRVVGGRSATGIPPTSEWKDQAREKVSEFKEVAGEKLNEWKSTTSDTASEWKEIASERLSEWSVIARDQVRHARRRAAFYTDEYPVQTILAFAGFAFVIGCALRIWRANSD